MNIRYDEEFILDDCIAAFKKSLNTEIAKINAEKLSIGDTLVLDPIADDNYVFATLSESHLNYKGFFLMYDLSDPGALKEASPEAQAEDATVTVMIGVFDQGEKERSNLLRKLLRYRRALREVVINSPDMFRGHAKPLLASLKPNAFEFNRVIVLTSGVDIKASITAT